MKVGVIGTGFGARVVAPAFARIPGVSLADAVSPRDAKAVEALCARPDVDLVSIHSPPFLHLEHVRLAAAAGKAVLCDKPLGRNEAEARACLEAVRRANAPHFLNFEFRCAPIREKLHEMVKAGAIGAIEHIFWRQLGSGAREPLRRHGWLFDAQLGGGWVGAWASHAVDFLHWIHGPVIGVAGRRRLTVTERPDRDGRLHPSTAEDGLSATLELAAGATALFDSTNGARGSLPLQIAVFGNEGILFDDADRRLTLIRGATNEVVAELEFSGDSHNIPMQRYAGRVRQALATQDAGELPTFEDGVAAAGVLDRLRGLPLAAR